MKSTIKDLLRALGYSLNKIQSAPAYANLAEDLPYFITRPQPTLFDVGANKGQTIGLFRRCFPTAKIEAFEPCIPIAEQYLKPLTLSNPQLRLHMMALSDSPGEREFFRYANDELSSLHSLSSAPDAWFQNQKLLEQSSVPISTVDTMMQSLGLQKIDLLKIDTQGGDLEVLQGSRISFHQALVEWVMIEVNMVTMYEGQPTFLEIHRFLLDHGLRFVHFYETVRGPNGSPHLAWATALYGR